jgi:hypothetical protein
MHALPLLLLVSLVLFHMLLQVTFQLFYVFNLNFLLFQLALRLLKLLMLVTESVDLSFKLVWLLLFNHADVASGYLL